MGLNRENIRAAGLLAQDADKHCRDAFASASRLTARERLRAAMAELTAAVTLLDEVLFNDTDNTDN